MTHKFKPGAKALTEGSVLGTILDTIPEYSLVQYPDRTKVWRRNSTLTPLIRAVVQSDETVKEVNMVTNAKMGKRHKNYEALLRTWKSTCSLPCGPGDFHENGKCFKNGCMAPGTIVLGYVKDDLFVILQKAEDNA